MTLREQVVQELDWLDEGQLQSVAAYLATLKSDAAIPSKPLLDDEQLALLYAEFAEEDRQWAEKGITDYLEGLHTTEYPRSAKVDTSP